MTHWPFQHEQHPPCDERNPIVALLLSLHRKVDWIMATLQDDRTALTNLIAKVDVLLAAFQAAQQNVNDPATLQSIFDDANAEIAKIDAAMNPAPPADTTPTA